MTLTTLSPVHRRRASLLLIEDSSDTHDKGSATQKMFDEDEPEGQGVEVSPPLQYGQSLKKRKGRPKVVHPQEPIQADLGQWPVLGGLRESDIDM